MLRVLAFFAVFLSPAWVPEVAFGLVEGEAFFLPLGWEVVSRDEPTEQGQGVDVAYSVRQVLYARTALGGGGALQVFSIWSTGAEGEALPLPGGVALGEELLASLLYVRYGQATRLGEGRFGAENFAVATYGVGAFRVERASRGELRSWRAIRYKCASLFRGERLFLLSIKYLPRHEDYWQEQFETLLRVWSASLSLTAGPTFEEMVIPVVVAAPPPIPYAPSHPPETPEAESKNPEAPVFYARGLAVSASMIFFVCSGGLFIRRRRREGTVSAPPDKITPDGLAPDLSPETAPPSDASLERAQETAPSEEIEFSPPEEGDETGFDRVYSLLGQALSIIENTNTQSGGGGEAPVPPSLEEAAEILEGLEERFGASFIMETMKGEVLEALASPSFRGITLECRVLKLCCGVLVNMARTGRYHIGKGILSSEGQELLALFTRVNELRALKSCGSPEEFEKDAAFMRFCVREKG
ncbi:MAG: hypothetical protein LBD04_11145 [Synergistaceae bacterium]|nr:hypothetical protein [Synergistaceae bacterium]